MVSATSLMIVFAFAVAALIVEITRRTLVSNSFLAVPNDRSFHENPTPSMGGIAIVVPVFVLLSYLWLQLDVQSARNLLLGGLLVAIIGGIDDVRDASIWLRLAVQACAAGLLLYGQAGDFSWWQLASLALVIIWSINLYNFMDGIDGLAVTQCVLFVIGCQLISGNLVGWVADVLWVLGAASIAFLGFNWAPAKIFMGDLGSSFLGFLLFGLVLQLNVSAQLPFIVSLILLTVFWFDASYTLCVRMVTGQRFMSAHRSHLYQQLAGKLGHEQTTGLFVGYWSLYLLPLAWLARSSPEHQMWCFLAACLPLLIAALYFRAGQTAGRAVD